MFTINTWSASSPSFFYLFFQSSLIRSSIEYTSCRNGMVWWYKNVCMELRRIVRYLLFIVSVALADWIFIFFWLVSMSALHIIHEQVLHFDSLRNVWLSLCCLLNLLTAIAPVPSLMCINFLCIYFSFNDHAYIYVCSHWNKKRTFSSSEDE